MASELLNAVALSFKRGDYNWLEAITGLRSQITSIASKARNKKTRMIYPIGIVPDEDSQHAEAEQSVYLHTIEKLFEQFESERVIEQLKFIYRKIPSEIGIGPSENLLEAHFSCVPNKLCAYLQKLQQDKEDQVGRKIKIGGAITKLKLKTDCLEWGEFKVPLESDVQRKIGKLLFEYRDEKRGAQSVKRGTPIALRKEAGLLKKKFPEDIKYFRRKIKDNFLVNNLKISILNPSRGKGEYIMTIRYPR